MDVVVCNNMVAIALSNNVLMRLDLSNPSEIDRKYAKILELVCLVCKEAYKTRLSAFFH